jgi:hypothetical protein
MAEDWEEECCRGCSSLPLLRYVNAEDLLLEEVVAECDESVCSREPRWSRRWALVVGAAFRCSGV